MLEKASAFKGYLERFGGTIEELSRQLGMNRATVSNMMRLLELPESIQQLLRSNKITGGHAKALLPLSEVQQNELVRQIEQEQLSVRRVEEIAREMLRAGTLPLPHGTDATAATEQTDSELLPGASNHVLGQQDFLRGHFGAKIDIRQKKNNAGQIVIYFAGNDDFERIVGRLRNAG